MGGQNIHQPAQRVAVRADIPGGDAFADKRRSGVRDASSVGTYAMDEPTRRLESEELARTGCEAAWMSRDCGEVRPWDCR